MAPGNTSLYRQAVINDPVANQASAALDYINNPGNVYSQAILGKIQEGDVEGARNLEIYNYINGD